MNQLDKRVSDAWSEVSEAMLKHELDPRIVAWQLKRLLSVASAPKAHDKVSSMRELPVGSLLYLSIRAQRTMLRLDVGTIGELLEKTAEDFSRCRGAGRNTLWEVKEKLAVHGLKLRTN